MEFLGLMFGLLRYATGASVYWAGPSYTELVALYWNSSMNKQQRNASHKRDTPVDEESTSSVFT